MRSWRSIGEQNWRHSSAFLYLEWLGAEMEGGH